MACGPNGCGIPDFGLDFDDVRLEVVPGNKTGDAATLKKGRKAYFDQECNSCHQLKEGEADLGPNLFEYGSEAWLLAFLRDPGHELFYAEDNQMPANEGELSETELEALVAYLQTLRGDDP